MDCEKIFKGALVLGVIAGVTAELISLRKDHLRLNRLEQEISAISNQHVQTLAQLATQAQTRAQAYNQKVLESINYANQLNQTQALKAATPFKYNPNQKIDFGPR